MCSSTYFVMFSLLPYTTGRLCQHSIKLSLALNTYHMEYLYFISTFYYISAFLENCMLLWCGIMQAYTKISDVFSETYRSIFCLVYHIRSYFHLGLKKNCLFPVTRPTLPFHCRPYVFLPPVVKLKKIIKK